MSILLSSLITVANAMDDGHRAWIKQSSNAESLTILPHVTAGHTARLSYELVSIKSDANGNVSTSRQSNTFDLKQGQSRMLSRLNLSVSPGDHYILKLKVFEGHQLVAEDVAEYPNP
jgi:hypothetical protein